MIQFLYHLADRLRHRARQRVETGSAATGRRGEDMAHRLLRQQGFTLVARNFRPRGGHGEIDLIAWHGDTLVFVEVKSRGVADFGEPDRAVDRHKRALLVRTGEAYARRAGVPWDRVRFDIVNVVLSDPPSVTRVQDAFRPGRAL